MNHSDTNNIEFEIQRICSDDIEKKEIELLVARLDQINSIISGNKIFKLHYFITNALKKNIKLVVTKGGYYSNHLVATAYYTKVNNLKSIGIIRGEKPKILSHTLKDCIKYGMQLIYVSRNDYNNEDLIQSMLQYEFKSYEFIPEGGFHPTGAKGASMIMNKINQLKATHVITAIGTATTIAGLVRNNCNHSEIIGVSVLKGLNDTNERLSFLNNHSFSKSPTIFHDYHFGGYAKYDSKLIKSMNEFYNNHKIPTDFVYTGKMIYGLLDLIKADYFKKGSKIIALHTGGLQGNQSLPINTLVF
jgi:1-aminocyclopropane-1-carboxylate deaminase/D-cysteine desulfhydrase-like pyridoxal-dependent ACC family enzyme